MLRPLRRRGVVGAVLGAAELAAGHGGVVAVVLVPPLVRVRVIRAAGASFPAPDAEAARGGRLPGGGGGGRRAVPADGRGLRPRRGHASHVHRALPPTPATTVAGAQGSTRRRGVAAAGVRRRVVVLGERVRGGDGRQEAAGGSEGVLLVEEPHAVIAATLFFPPPFPSDDKEQAESFASSVSKKFVPRVTPWRSMAR